MKNAKFTSSADSIYFEAGISDVTFYNWRKKYDGLFPSEMRYLRQLEEENAKLKQITADQAPDKAMLQNVLSKKL